MVSVKSLRPRGKAQTYRKCNDCRMPFSIFRSPTATAFACARSRSGTSRQASKMFSPARTSRPARAFAAPETRHALLVMTTIPIESRTQTSPGNASSALSTMRFESCSAVCASGSSRALTLLRSMTASISPASNATSSAVSVTNRRSQALNSAAALSGASSGSVDSGASIISPAPVARPARPGHCWYH